MEREEQRAAQRGPSETLGTGGEMSYSVLLQPVLGLASMGQLLYGLCVRFCAKFSHPVPLDRAGSARDGGSGASTG